MSCSMTARKAASVLPEPVGAATNTSRPAWMAGHASACACVGASKVRVNHAATAGWNDSRALMTGALQGGFQYHTPPRTAGQPYALAAMRAAHTSGSAGSKPARGQRRNQQQTYQGGRDQSPKNDHGHGSFDFVPGLM